MKTFSSIQLSLVITIFCFAAMSHAASFDCVKASTLVEKAICSDKQLSDLDDLLMQSYKKAMANSPKTDTLKSEQRAWLVNVRNKCQDLVCLTHAYNERLTALNNTTVNVSKKEEGNVHASNNVQGKYVMKKANNAGEVGVAALSGNKFKFSIVTAVGAYTCQEEGEIILNVTNRTATFKGEEGCVISFKFTDNSVKIETTDCAQSCGVGGYMDGVFTKTKSSSGAENNASVVYSNLEKYTGQHPEKGLFKDKKINPALKKLLGKYYQTFINNMDTVEDPEYSNGILVVSGAVPGLFTISEAIVQIEKTGPICAAILDDGKILYFTNSPKYKDNLPASFKEWKQRFDNVKVISASK